MKNSENFVNIGNNTHILKFDVRDKKAVFEAFNSLPESWKDIEILVNNAGNAHGLDPVQSASIDDWDAMIDSNVKGLMYVTKAVLPKMIKSRKGHIINLGSIAGKFILTVMFIVAVKQPLILLEVYA